MAKIIVLRGLIASGKTTWARNWVNQDPEKRVRFNKDDIRNMIRDQYHLDKESLVKHIQYDFICAAMSDGYDIVIDNNSLNPEHIEDIRRIMEGWNSFTEDEPYTLEVNDECLYVPLETCIERDKKRDHPIGEYVIRRMYDKYKHDIEPWKYLI